VKVANTEQVIPQRQGQSLIVQIAMLLGVTAAAIGMGWLSGNYLNSHSGTDAPAHGEAEAAGPIGESGHNADAASSTTLALPAITTNLAAPGEIWVRLEVALVFDTPPAKTLADDIHQDLLGFLRSVKLHQVEGASGFQHLKADLEERARIRSDGAVKKLLIRTLIFE
jgi:flagellar FliL protein